MGHGLDTEFAAKAVDDPQGAVAGTAAGAIGYGDEGWLQALQGRHRFAKEGRLRLVRFRREKLKRNGWLGTGVQFRNSQAILPPFDHLGTSAEHPTNLPRSIQYHRSVENGS